MKRILIFWLLIGYLGLGQTTKEAITIPIDTSTSLSARPGLKNLDEKYSGEEFDYDIKTGESQNLIARFINWVGRWLDNTFGIQLSPSVFNILKWIIYALMTGLVIYLIIKLLVNERFESLFTKQAKNFAGITLSEQHIETVDFDALLQRALSEKNYRLAVRYQFLKMLKTLSQKNVIDWHFEKTNTDYQKEIKTEELRKSFASLAYLYDYVWYGEQPMNEDSFQKAQKRFEQMNLKLGVVNG